MNPKGWFEWVHDVLGGQINCDDLCLPGYSPMAMVWSSPKGVAKNALEELR